MGNIVTRGNSLVVLAAVVLFGCSSLGPQTIVRDRFDYNTAISESWKEQILLNIVKVRYADVPLFLEVASIVSGYTIESSVNLGGSVSSQSAVQGDFLELGASGTYTDRPTITYAPITGAKFNKNFMTPIPPNAVLFLLQSGWPADVLFPFAVDAINGLRSEIAIGTGQRSGDSGYYRLIDLFRKIQASGAVGMRIKKGDEGGDATLLILHGKNITPEVAAAQQEIRQLLGLKPGQREFTITYGQVPADDSQIAILTRSMLQMMIKLAGEIDVPPEHIDAGMTVPSRFQPGSDEDRLGGVITISSSSEKPERALTAVKYRDYWFSIDDGDFRSKRAFALLMILFSLMETGDKDILPVVTINAG